MKNILKTNNLPLLLVIDVQKNFINKKTRNIPSRIENLIHLVNKETLREQNWKQQRNKASGIDKVTKDEYEMNLENLISRMKKFSYKPLSVRRTYSTKANG